MDPASKVVVRTSSVFFTRSALLDLQQVCLLPQVIKIGTSSLLRPDHSSINLSSLARICETVKELRKMGKSSNVFSWLYRVTRRTQNLSCTPCRTQSRAGVKRSDWCRLSKNGSESTPNRPGATTGSGCSRPDTPHALLSRVLSRSRPGERMMLVVILPVITRTPASLDRSC